MKRGGKFLKITGIVTGIILLAAILYVQISSNIGSSHIIAEFDGLGTTLLAVSSSSIDDTESERKLAFSFNDKFNIKLSPQKTSSVRIVSVLEGINRDTFRSKTINFFLDPNSEVEIKGKTGEISYSYDIVKGNKLSKQKNELRKVLLPYYEKESQLYKKAKVSKEENPEKSRAFTEQFDSLRFYVVAPLRTQWAKNNLNYELSPRYFLESHIPKDTVKKYFNLLSDNAKNSVYGQFLGGIVAGWNNSEIGKMAPAINQKTIFDENFILENYRDKYVVLDFWGTWCAPCIKEMPTLKEYYSKYNQKVEFVGIACHDELDKVKETVEDNKLNWVHLFNDKSLEDLAILYGVTSYPTKFIIDPKGKIIGRFKGANDEFYQTLDELMES